MESNLGYREMVQDSKLKRSIQVGETEISEERGGVEKKWEERGKNTDEEKGVEGPRESEIRGTVQCILLKLIEGGTDRAVTFVIWTRKKVY